MNEWIHCSDRMPVAFETVLIGKVGVPWPVTAFWTGQKWCRDVMKEEFHPTHWMPLPEPPKSATG